MGEVQWIKFYIDMFDKRKIKKLRRLPAGNDLLLIWVMLLAMAGKCNAGGHIYITPTVPFQEEDLADELDFDVNTIRLALGAFSELGMISLSDDGFIYISNWEKYQSADKLEEIREQTRKRVGAYRERKRLESATVTECNVTRNATVTECNAIEEDKEEEEEGEKELHSFVHSHAHEENILENLQNNSGKSARGKGQVNFARQNSEGAERVEYREATDATDYEAALDEYVRAKVEKAGFDDPKYDAVYEAEVRENLKRKYMGEEGVVLLSNEQFDDLCRKLSLEELHKYMGIIADCELSGKKYKKKTHYQAILDMAAKDRRIKK